MGLSDSHITSLSRVPRKEILIQPNPHSHIWCSALCLSWHHSQVGPFTNPWLYVNSRDSILSTVSLGISSTVMALGGQTQHLIQLHILAHN